MKRSELLERQIANKKSSVGGGKSSQESTLRDDRDVRSSTASTERKRKPHGNAEMPTSFSPHSERLPLHL